jgi:hypothetical protein
VEITRFYRPVIEAEVEWVYFAKKSSIVDAEASSAQSVQWDNHVRVAIVLKVKQSREECGEL